ncbi:MAG TPA: hypothetical protein VGD60_17040 [Candidatus Acidoferrales bacterium]
MKLHHKIRLLIFALVLCAPPTFANFQEASQQAPTQAPTSAQASPPPAPPALPRGKKLMLKDGTFQLVREYHVEGDRVRYYSIDQMGWEEIPEPLVDWDATRKMEMGDAKRSLDLIAEARKSEIARNAEPLDVDASLEIAPKVFLPGGAGLFEFDGKAIYPLAPAEPDIKFSMTQRVKQVLVPIPIIPSRHTVSLDGEHAKFRSHSNSVEFYMRAADGHEPNLELIRAKVHSGKRSLENLDQLFGQKQASGRIALPLLRWEVARGVYRYTIYQPLEAGEYAVVETIESGGTNVLLWDFGVDLGAVAAKPVKP